MPRLPSIQLSVGDGAPYASGMSIATWCVRMETFMWLTTSTRVV